MKQRMKVPHEKGVAIRSASSLALGIASEEGVASNHDPYSDLKIPAPGRMESVKL